MKLKSQLFGLITLSCLALIQPATSFAENSGGVGGGGGHEVVGNGELLDIFQAESKVSVDPKADPRFAGARAIIQNQIDHGITDLGTTLNYVLTAKKWYFTKSGTQLICSDASTVFKVKTQAVACQDEHSIIVDSDWFQNGGGSANPKLNRNALLIHEVIRNWGMITKSVDEATIQDLTAALATYKGDLTQLVSLIEDRNPSVIRMNRDGSFSTETMKPYSESLTRNYLRSLVQSGQATTLNQAWLSGMTTYCHLSPKGHDVDQEAQDYVKSLLHTLPNKFDVYSGDTLNSLLDLFGYDGIIYGDVADQDPSDIRNIRQTLRGLQSLGFPTIQYYDVRSGGGIALQRMYCPAWRKAGLVQ